MSEKQLPLPGMEDLAYSEAPASLFLLYAAHCELRSEIVRMFNAERLVLRAMGADNGESYPSDVYAAQRGLVIALKELVGDLDALNGKIEGMFHAR